ncbi:MAG TPA: beta-ketoacyl synthase chain length factor [Flavihumibacter sp.]|jgi:hypothetical protein
MISPLYIRAARAITPQDSFKENELHPPYASLQGNRFVYKEPVYQDYFTIMQLRRMSRLTRIGLVAAIECLKDAQQTSPDAIITGTGKGSLHDTEKFMHSIREFNEGTLNPSPFIQSTYNSLNGLIGLHHQVHSYNSTYVHRGFSLEHAFIDAALLMGEGTIQNALVGSYEEMTSEHYIIKNKLGYWKTDEEIRQMVESGLPISSPGAISGEGSFFFYAQKDRDGASLAIKDIRLWYEPDAAAITAGLDQLLADHGIGHEQLDCCLLGRNTDSRYDYYYDRISEQLGPATHQLQFKQYCGEFDTAGGFGLWAASRMAAKRAIHPDLIVKKGSAGQLRYGLLYNHYFGRDHAMYLLEFL